MPSLRSKKSKGKLPPGPRGWPIIGNLFHTIMNRPVHVWIHRCMEDMQTEIACFRFSRVHVITVTSSEIAREVLREKDEALADRTESYSSNFISHGYKEVIFSSYGESWKLMKKMMTTKLMSPTTLNKALADRTLEADNIVTYVFNLPRKGSINVRDVALTYCHAVMMRMMFGQRHFDVAAEDGGLGPKEKEHIDAIYRALDCFFSFNVTNYIPFLRGWNIDNEEAEVREAVDILNRCNDPIIHDRLHLWRTKGGKETEEDWLDILVTLKDDQGLPLFTFDEIRAQCKDINVATIDNTMNNCWLFLMLILIQNSDQNRESPKLGLTLSLSSIRLSDAISSPPTTIENPFAANQQNPPHFSSNHSLSSLYHQTSSALDLKLLRKPQKKKFTRSFNSTTLHVTNTLSCSSTDLKNLLKKSSKPQSLLHSCNQISF
ncbi:Cytochrome P450 protein [Raphanus sativus]|nr:Cytochrome P450 protein [Raphanus sativus]